MVAEGALVTEVVEAEAAVAVVVAVEVLAEAEVEVVALGAVDEAAAAEAEVEGFRVVAGVVVEVAVEEKEETSLGRMCWWSPIGMKVSSFAEERKMHWSPRTWFPGNLFMERRESLSRKEKKKLSTAPGTPSAPNWQQRFWVVWTRSTSSLGPRCSTLGPPQAPLSPTSLTS